MPSFGFVFCSVFHHKVRYFEGECAFGFFVEGLRV